MNKPDEESPREMIAQSMNTNGRTGMGAVQCRRVAVWVMLSVLAALLCWFGFRGYLNPELLFHFANSLYC